MEENFDYKAALERLEQIARSVEDPQTALDSIDGLVKESETLLKACREYLHGYQAHINNEEI